MSEGPTGGMVEPCQGWEDGVGKASRRKGERHGNQRESRYYPGVIPIDDDALGEVLLATPAEILPSLGLAWVYLFSTPNRQANQCLAATAALSIVQRSLGMESEPVGLMLDVPSAGRIVRYGNEHPHYDGRKLVGHVGLVVDGFLLDPTAGQFPEMRSRRGARPLCGRLPVSQADVLKSGAIARVRLQGGGEVQYHVQPKGSADDVFRPLLQDERQGLAITANNLNIMFGLCMGVLGDTRIGELRCRYPKVADLAERMIGANLVDNDGVFGVEYPS